MAATITWKDGTTLRTETNCNNFIVDTEPVWPEDMSEVTVVDDEEGTYVLHNASVLKSAPLDNRFWFIFTEESVYERTILQLREENEMLESAIVELAELLGGD